MLARHLQAMQLAAQRIAIMVVSLLAASLASSCRAGCRVEFTFHQAQKTAISTEFANIDGEYFELIDRHWTGTSNDNGKTMDYRSTTTGAPYPLDYDTFPKHVQLIQSTEQNVQINVSAPGPGAPWQEYATRIYEVDLTYTPGVRLLYFFSRSLGKVTEHFEVTVADLACPTAAIWQRLRGGYAQNLAKQEHTETMSGFPVKIVGTINSQGKVHHFYYEAINMIPWEKPPVSH